MRIKQSFYKYDVEEGFEDQPISSQPMIQFKKQPISGYCQPTNKDKIKSHLSNQQEEAKLKFISIERQLSHSSHYNYLKEEQEKIIHKSMTLSKQDQSFLIKKQNRNPRPLSKLPPLENYTNSVTKIKRSQIGENLQLNQYNSPQLKILKENLINQGATLIFEDNRSSSSHGLFKKFLKTKNSNSFLKSKYNISLLHKLNNSFINSKNYISTKSDQINLKKDLQFISDFESSNLDFVTQINPYEYDIYTKPDTNSLGHQNWFYFKLLNNSQDNKNIFINVCNLKRGFKMVKRGQKIFYRFRKIIKTHLKTSIENQDEEWSNWEKLSEEVTVSSAYQGIRSQNIKKRRVYKLSFSSSLISESEYQFSLLPPFTYSEMLKQVEYIDKTCRCADVEILTFSLLGLSIPLITFTNKQISNSKKNVILISARIHPGQTCASFVSKGILEKLSQQTEQKDQFLSNHIIKIIPMINPDGVVLGNFRTNYLGNDLNRCFNQENQITFPEIIGLKQIGKKLKQEYKERFLCFIDLHGHSSQKNIFIYGPNYDQNHKKFRDSRFIPKTLYYLAPEFDYDKCTFNLEQCKSNTARGYFIKHLKTMAFTIESSYALFDSNKQSNIKNQDLKIQNWICFGKNIIKSLQIWSKSNTLTKTISSKNQQNQTEKVNQHSQLSDQIIIVKINKEIGKQTISPKKITKRKNSSDQQKNSAQDTDGESESEDIPVRQRQKLERKLIDLNNNTHLFPRILRPAIIHPQVNPPVPLFSVSKINPTDNSIKGSIINSKIKKNRYINTKPVSVNNAYTEYLLKEIKGLQSLRPSVNLMKISRKQSVLMRSSQLDLK